MVLDYGNAVLKNIKGTNLSSYKVLFKIGVSLMSLKQHQDVLHYLDNQYFNSVILVFRNREIDSFAFLSQTRSFLDCQVKNKQFVNAFKATKMLKIFKLDSMNPDEVKNVCTQLLVQKPSSKQDYNNYGILFLIRDICLMKCEILKGRADFMANIYHDIHLDLRKQKVEKCQNFIQDSLIKAIAAFLNVLQTVCEPKMREKCFKWLFFELNSDLLEKSHGYYITNAVEKYSIDIDDLLPFLTFFISYCETEEAIGYGMKFKDENLENTDQGEELFVNVMTTVMELKRIKKYMINFKNSLLIDNYFKKLAIN